jgi:hypothetical protein
MCCEKCLMIYSCKILFDPEWQLDYDDPYAAEKWGL